MSSATISVVAHAVLVVGWIAATMPSAEVAPDSIANRVYYIPPPDRVPATGGTREQVHYVKLAREGPGTGEGPRMMGEARPPAAPDTTLGDQAKDSVTLPPVHPSPSQDSVFSVLQVDTAVVRSASSAAPAYPVKLLEHHVMGYVQAQYVVDTTGFADTSSFRVVTSTNPEFVTAVKEALPYMRFHPAKIGQLKVRQLVEQQFSFRILNPDTTKTDTAKVKKPKPGSDFGGR